MHRGIKVVTSEEMGRIEKGGDHESYMLQAGQKVAIALIDLVEEKNLPKEVTLLVGKGNNGGDAYAAGVYLLKEGFSVSSYSPFAKGSSLSQKFEKRFRNAGGKRAKAIRGVVIDGLLGTGFKGRLEKPLQDLIERVNRQKLFVVSIDIPSGVNGTSGNVDPIAIKASVTVALGLPKIGLFIEKGWEYVGMLRLGDFGLPEEAIAEAEALCYLPTGIELPEIKRVRHKYEAGLVIGYSGSSEYRGAPKLAGYAALKVGAGMVQVFHKGDVGDAPFELIFRKWSEKDWKKELLRAHAAFIGPGLGECKAWVKKHLAKISIPVVVDADALFKEAKYPKGSVLTPHRGEAMRLLGISKKLPDEKFFAKIQRYVTKQGVFMLLKGAPTFLFAPHQKPIVIARGDPGMATAGMGDVLTGMIAGFIAQGCTPYEGALIGANVHALAGEVAAKQLTSYSLSARNVIEVFPEVFRYILQNTSL